MTDVHTSVNEPILYELLEYVNWKQEPELIKCKNDAVILSTTGTIKNALKYLNNRYSLPECISNQIGLTSPWKFAIGDQGRLLAIVTDNFIEIRKAKDEYSSINSKTAVPKDSFPRWRKMLWSPDGSILVVASSNGNLSFYNTLGINVYNIGAKSICPNPNVLEAGDAIASLLFLEPKTKDKDKWSNELLVVTYSGLLKSYNTSNNNYRENYEFSFGNFYRNGINMVIHDRKHDVLIVAGNTIIQKFKSKSSDIGLTSWRRLNDYPYHKLSFVFEGSIEIEKKFSLWSIIPILNSNSSSIIFKMKISPNDRRLACVHTDGTISLWQIPNFTLEKKWKLVEQPNFNLSSNNLESVEVKKFPSGFTEYHPMDIGWWSDLAIIIARYSGSISVCSIDTLENLLGTSPEFLFGPPQIHELDIDHGFLVLDCEIVITSKKRTTSSHSEDLSSDGENNYEPAPVTDLLKSALYFATDIEKFQPKRKKSKFLYQTCRLLGLKSTTPEELYSRKIDIQEYEEALALANTYNLDKDLVYQTQWRKSNGSVDAIKEHLSKVSKRCWVLNECVTRVPDTIEAARKLLDVGLAETSSEKIMLQTDKIEMANLSKGQKELIKYRRKLLDHSDKLQLYEIIIKSPEKYNKNLYQEFRQLSPIENAIRFAKDSDSVAVEIMFTYYRKKLLPYWLSILNYFPETLNPRDYKNLVPICDEEGELRLPDERELREPDWSEMMNFDESDNIEERYPRYDYYSLSLLENWYRTRAYEIEKNSCLVDHALQLIGIGRNNNIKNLENLLSNLETLDDMVYKLSMEDMSLDKLDKLKDLEKIIILMSLSNRENFVDNIYQLLIPFIKRLESSEHLFYDYLIHSSKNDLNFLTTLFEYLKNTDDTAIDKMIDSKIALAADCIYACNDPEMYKQAEYIVENVSKSDIKRTRVDEELLEDLEKEIYCLRILNRHGVAVTFNYIKKNFHNTEAVKLLFKQMAINLNHVHHRDEKQWTLLLNEMLEIRTYPLSCVEIDTCFEICLYARLMSGSREIIKNSTSLMECNRNEESLLKVPYAKAVELILEASQEYFNTSKSLMDRNIELAKTCLHLVTDSNSKIKEELDLINAIQILFEFDIQMLPLQVRLKRDKLILIEECLRDRPEVYKNRHKLINLGNYLRIEGSDKVREGKITELVGKKALQVEDYKVCAVMCQRLMEMNYVQAWPVILNLGSSDNFDDFKIRNKCLWFAMNHAADDKLSEIMEGINSLQIQTLNKNLQFWVPNDEKTFVPSNWNLMNWNLIKEDEESLPKNYELQSFPSFYKDLHKSEETSCYDTKYDKYSIPDLRNRKLKCLQTLMRINLLNKEVNDIDHLYLECASNTMQENWLLGFSYLFSLRRNKIQTIDNFFLNMPKNRLYSQTALYFYALELYKQFHGDDNNLYMYDPANLIEKVSSELESWPESDLKDGFVDWKRKTETTEWTEDWGDFSYDDDESEDKRFKKFEIKFNDIESKENYLELKGLLLKWPKFVDPRYTRIDNNPILRTMALVTTYILDETSLLEEYREFVTKLIDEKVLKEFLQHNVNCLTTEENIYMRLCSREKLLHEEAVCTMKEKYEGKKVKLQSKILEELFLNNLTASFGPEHPIYNQIIEQVFQKNPTILKTAIEQKQYLLNTLIKNNHLTHAMEIINLIEKYTKQLNLL